MASEQKILALRKAIENGVDIRDLKNHPGFQLILELLKSSKEEAFERFLDADPTDIKMMQHLHYRAWRYDELLGLLQGVLIEAREAENELHDELE